MIARKLHFPICIIWMFFFFISCENQKDKNLENKVYDALIEKAEDYSTNQKYDSAFYYYFKAKEACTNNEKDRIAYALFNLADIQQKHCDYAESEATATSIIALDPNYKYIYSTYNLLGLGYLEQYNYQSAIKYFNLASKTALNQADKLVYNNNIAYTLLESKKYHQAKQLLTKTLQNKLLITDKFNYARVLDNLGFTYFKMNNTKALDYLKQSFKIRDSLKNDYELIASYVHLSKYYQNYNQSLAKDYATKAYQAATKANSPDDRLEALKLLITNANANEIKNLSLEQIQISDSINLVRQTAKTQFAKIKYDASLALKESENQKTQKQLYLSLAVFIAVLSLVLFIAIRSRNKRKLQIISYETETRIAKKLHDELANDVFNTMTFADTQNLNDPDKKELLIENLDKIYTQARNISRENNQIDTGANFEQILKEMLSGYSNAQVNIIINKINTIEWLKLQKEAKIALYRTLQELMVNMKKHSQCSLVLIGFENLKNTIEITYSDNGIGCVDMLNLKKGLQNAENRIFTIKGSIIFESENNKGFKAKITIPK